MSAAAAAATAAAAAQAIVVAGDTEVRSQSDIFTKDVVWFVDESTRLTFRAPTVTLARSKVCV